MWAKLRGTNYLAGIAGMIGVILAALGYATYDLASGEMIVPEFRINLYALAAGLPVAASPVVALVALIKGWRK